MTKGIHDPGETIGARYTVEEVIGRGGCGVVYRAWDQVTGHVVAVKMLDCTSGTRLAALTRFHQEGKALARIQSPHVPCFHTAGRDAGHHFIVMEHVAGSTLERSIDDGVADGCLPRKEQVFHVLRELTLALAAVHAEGFVHGDVKPGNVIVERATGRTVLVDLGLVRGATRAGAVAMGLGAGTPAYMAPELLGAVGRIGPAADQYGLACLAYELFTGRPPFAETDGQVLLRMHQQVIPEPASTFRPSLPLHVDVALARALSKSPDARYRSCRAFASAACRDARGPRLSSIVERTREYLGI